MKHLSGGYAGKIVALLLLVFLFSSAAMAEGAPAFSPMLDDWFERIEGGEAVDVSISALLHALLPYGEQTVEAMNRLLSECRVQSGYRQNGQEVTAQTRLIIGGIPAVDFLELSQAQATFAQTSLLPGTTLTSATHSPLNFLLGSGEEIPFWAGDIPDPNKLAEKIPAVLAGLHAFGKEKVSTYRLSSACTAKKAVIYTVPAESVQLIRDSFLLLADELGWPEAAALFAELTMDGEAVFTLYQTAEGENIGLGIKATMGFENVATRMITFLWAFSAVENMSQHTLSLKAPAVKGADYLTVAGEWKLGCLKDQNVLTFSLDSKSKLNNQSLRTQWKGKLDCLMAEDSQRLEGEIERIYTDAGKTSYVLSIKPSLCLNQAGDKFSVKGSARLKWSRNKSLLTDITFSMMAGSTSGVRWAETENTVSLDDLGEAELAMIKQNAQDAAVKAIWQAVLSLPPDCLTLISKNISQEDWARLYKDAFIVGQ